MRIGVLGLQGAVSEHVISSGLALQGLGIEGDATEVRELSQIKKLDCLILPGGESTTISYLSGNSGITTYLRTSGLPILATCAGMVLLGTSCDGPAQNLIGRIDMEITRNAFGPQRESFETLLDVGTAKKFPAVFIRAPVVSELKDPKAKPIARFQNKIVGVQKGSTLALSFHPELTNDLRIHKKWIQGIA